MRQEMARSLPLQESDSKYLTESPVRTMCQAILWSCGISQAYAVLDLMYVCMYGWILYTREEKDYFKRQSECGGGGYWEKMNLIGSNGKGPSGNEDWFGN